MRGTKEARGKISRRMHSVMLAILLVIAGAGSAFGGPADYDVPESRSAADVVPPELLRGPHYQIGSPVETFTYMNRYSVTSDFGGFNITGDARLRRLVREIVAVAKLHEVRHTKAFADAAGQAAMGPVRAAKSMIEDPVSTIAAVPEGIFSVFGRVSEQITRGGRSQYEDGLAKSVFVVSGYKRDYARDLGIDVYSSNEILQKELNSVAWAAAAGNLTVGMLTAASGSAAVKVAGNIRLLDTAQNLVAAEPPEELSKRNRKSLGAMRVPEATAERFLGNRVLSPRHQTIIVEAMRLMGAATGRAAFIQYSAQAENEDSALLFQQAAELLAGYHATVAPIRRLEIQLNLPVGYTAAETAVVMVPIDRLLWTDRTAGIVKQLGASLSRPTSGRKREVWITGDASPLARREMSASGFGLVERAGSRIPLLD